MPHDDFDEIRNIRDFPSLIRYLRTRLDWPVDEQDANDLTFDYTAEELGLSPEVAVKTYRIKQLRPLTANQPWGIFWIDFGTKRLPVVAMRHILNALVRKQRAGRAHQKTWDMRDLMFISATSAGNERCISFGHFQEQDGKNQLRTFSWDVRETNLYFIKNFKLDLLKWPDHPADAEGWRAQWSAAFTVEHRYVIRTAQQLAQEMARIACDIRQAVNDLYALEHSGGPLHGLHLSLKMSLITDLEADDFADMYAQTVTYGLFAARATRQGAFAGGSVAALIAHANPFLRELLEQMMDQDAVDLDGLGVMELVDLLKQVNMEEILMDFGRRGEDPVIHFYETFMKHYDPVQKTRRGEFYTPDAAVSFIVRSVDHLLRTEFGCPDGLLSTAGTGSFAPVILDPATGTGTFLKYVIQEMYANFVAKYRSRGQAEVRRLWNEYMPVKLLPRLYGFELKMSPYAIAHLKLGLALQETGYHLKEGERLRIYLSNALQPAHEVARVDTPALAHEMEHANEVKNKVPVSVVIGNPPYSYESTNTGNWISQLIQEYYSIDGKPLNEKNPKGLQDDYVKFIRMGENIINTSKKGVLAFITNHGYLNNPTFRGMRKHLLKTFDQIFIIDLHGNAKKSEISPDGSKDENVFDILQGVAICIMLKTGKSSNDANIFHYDLFGSREKKYEFLLTNNINSLGLETVTPTAPFYLFKPQDISLLDEYQQGTSISEMFTQNSVGISTSRDSLTIGWDSDEIEKLIRDFANLPVEVAREKYELGDDSQDWKVRLAQEDIKKSKFNLSLITKLLYRPFDIRFTYFTGRVKGFHSRPRNEIMSNFLMNYNLGLCSNRQVNGKFRHTFVTRNIIDGNSVSLATRERTYVFPLYLYHNSLLEADDQISMFGGKSNNSIRSKEPNIDPKEIKHFESSIDLQFIPDGTGDLRATFGPEDVLHYLYAVFNSPAYRQRYAEFLKIDFPRLPLTNNLELFRQLCGLGAQLVGLHLLEDERVESRAIESSGVKFVTGQTSSVAAGFPKYEAGRVFVNPEHYFEGVPEEIWNFHIGGYQVCHKWLKDRRGRELSAEDIVHYQKIVVALKETIRLMGEVDTAIESAGGWPMK